MPTKTYKRIPAQRARPFQPSETELFSMEICHQMASELDIDDPDEITRLHRILNDAGSFSHLATYVKTEGVPSGSQRASLKNFSKLLERTIEANDELDWQSNECIAAGYAKEEPVFTASADRISSPFYSQRERDVEALRRIASAVEFAEAHLNTSSKARLGIEILQAKYVIEAFEQFTGQPIRGERSNKKGRNRVSGFLQLGVNHITGGRLTVAQIGYVIRQAAEKIRQQRKITVGGNHPSAGR
jgi:hypothetical protein